MFYGIYMGFSVQQVSNPCIYMYYIYIHYHNILYIVGINHFGFQTKTWCKTPKNAQVNLSVGAEKRNSFMQGALCSLVGWVSSSFLIEVVPWKYGDDVSGYHWYLINEGCLMISLRIVAIFWRCSWSIRGIPTSRMKRQRGFWTRLAFSGGAD